MSTITEVIYKGFENEIAVTVKLDNAIVDWTAATGFTLTINDTDITSGITGGADSVITLDIGTLLGVIPLGTYETRLAVTDASHPTGQIVIDENGEDKLVLKIV